MTAENIICQKRKLRTILLQKVTLSTLTNTVLRQTILITPLIIRNDPTARPIVLNNSCRWRDDGNDFSPWGPSFGPSYLWNYCLVIALRTIPALSSYIVYRNNSMDEIVYCNKKSRTQNNVVSMMGTHDGNDILSVHRALVRNFSRQMQCFYDAKQSIPSDSVNRKLTFIGLVDCIII